MICDEAGVACELHLYDAHGEDRPGFPVAVAGQCFPFSSDLATGRNAVAYVACSAEGARDVVHAFDVTGIERAGWPVALAGGLEYVSWNDFDNPCSSRDLPSLEEGPDGTVYVATARPADRTGFSLEAYAADGRPRPGWPRRFARAEVPGFTVGPDGTIYAWWFEGVVGGECSLEARLTRFTAISPGGKTLAGWPISSVGAASGPLAGKDSTLYYVSEKGNVYAHDRKGRVKPGWPHHLPAPAAPALSTDGRLVFLFNTRNGSEVLALAAAGKVAPGWPYRTKGPLAETPMCSTPSASPILSALAPDGTLYVVSQGGVVALDRRGRTVAGWPYRLPKGSVVTDLSLDAYGRLEVGIATGGSYPCYETGTHRTVTLTSTGEPVH
jgi:hypothetical protein